MLYVSGFTQLHERKSLQLLLKSLQAPGAICLPPTFADPHPEIDPHRKCGDRRRWLQRPIRRARRRPPARQAPRSRCRPVLTRENPGSGQTPASLRRQTARTGRPLASDCARSTHSFGAPKAALIDIVESAGIANAAKTAPCLGLLFATPKTPTALHLGAWRAPAPSGSASYLRWSTDAPPASRGATLRTPPGALAGQLKTLCKASITVA